METFILTARDPAGPWSDPTWLPFAGIDPSIFFDDDGRAYVLNNGPAEGEPLYLGHRAIWIQEIDLRTLTMVGPRTVLVNGGADLAKRPIWIEGPHLFKRDGRYLLIAAEGGPREAHAEVVFAADRLRGPYRPGPVNPILTQRDLDPRRPDPITSTGHADFVQTPKGEWWAVFLGTQPYSDDQYNTGRGTFLLPVRWRGGWPVITGPGEAVPRVVKRPDLPRPRKAMPPTTGDFGFADDFTAPTLALRWTQLRLPRETWWRSGGGALTLKLRPESLGGRGQPSFLAVRQSHRNASVTVDVDAAPRGPSERAGLAAFQDETKYFSIPVTGSPSAGRVVRLDRRLAKEEPQDGVALASAPLPGAGPVRLRVEARGGELRFAYDPERRGVWSPVGAVQDGSVLSTAKAGGFTGVVLGVHASSRSRP